MVSNPMDARTAVVTGGAQGIGFAVAKLLLEAGRTVVIWDHNRQNLDKALVSLSTLGEVTGSVLDVRDQTSIADASGKLPGGGADILVSSAAIVIKDQPAFETSLDEWKATLDVNVIVVFNCCRQLVPGMVRKGWGRVVNIASMSGKDGTAGMAAYSASKAAVIGLTKAVGKEYAQSGVLINCVAPSIIDTPGVGQVSPEIAQVIAARAPMGRMGRPEEVAELIVWLCSSQCSYSTGAVYDISGGRAVY